MPLVPTETPLTLAARIKKPARMIVALVNGGALLDYRTRDGVTAMHRGVQASNFEAVKTLLGESGLVWVWIGWFAQFGLNRLI